MGPVAQSAKRLARAGRSGDRILVGARFSAPIQTGPGTHSASFKMGTGSFPGVKSGRGVLLTNNLILLPWSRKSRAIPLLPLCVVRLVKSVSACTRLLFIFLYQLNDKLLSLVVLIICLIIKLHVSPTLTLGEGNQFHRTIN